MAINPDGTKLITGIGNSIRLWDIATGAYRECTGYSGDLRSLAYSPDGRFFTSSTASISGRPSDNTIKVWDDETGQIAMSLTGHTGDILSIAYSPNGQQIVSCSRDGTIKLWDTVSGRILRSISADCTIVAYCPDGRRIAAATNNRIIIYDTQNGRELNAFTGHRAAVIALVFSPDGSRLLSADRNNNIKIWNMSNGWEAGQIRTVGYDIGSIAVSPDGNYFAVVKPESSITIYGIEE
jgi:WD40 repeat protein